MHAAPRLGRRRLAAVGLAIAAVATAAVTTSTALFTDSATVPDMSFATSNVDINSDASAINFTPAALAPGGAVVAPLTVRNDGGMQLRYALTSLTKSGSDAGLTSALQFTVKTGVSNCTLAGFGTDGTVAYGPSTISAASPGQKILGDPATGAQAGDRVLAAGANEVLCLRVGLPTSADNSVAGKTTTATLTFTAEQTVNN